MPLYSIHHSTDTSRAFERSPRVLLETDASSLESLPVPARDTLDSALFGDLSIWPCGKVPAGIDGVVTWLAGEQLFSGSSASIRHALRSPGRRLFVPVHVPCLEELPLLAFEPRWSSSGPAHDYWDFSVRIARADRPSPLAIAALQSSGQPWAKISLALLADPELPGRGIESLTRLWETHQHLPPILGALALRNLIVLLIRHRETARAEQLLEHGLQTLPGYAELSYIAAWLHLKENRAARAVPCLDKARTGDRGWLGCGGESTYRADWLLGLVALRVGNERMAFDHFRRGLLADPVFSPAVEQLLRLRLPPRLVAAHEAEFQRAAWHNPPLFEKIFDFLVQHRAFQAAEQLIGAGGLEQDRRQQLQERLRGATAFLHPPPEASNSPGILLHGPLFEYTSLGRINRELAASVLSCPSWTVCLEPSAVTSLLPRIFPNGDRLSAAILRPLTHLNLTIRHQWPPDFRRPTTGKLAVILPWEYGALPCAWVREIERNVDQLWVPSHFVRDVFLRSGVTRTPVLVLPNGFDPSVFTPQGAISRPQGCRKFVFLFVGGAIRRKGVDLLLDTYRTTFDPGEDVTLLLHVSGLRGSYKHNSLTQRLQEIASDRQAPHVQILSDAIDDSTLANLYRGSDVVVLPYRGEGFGMPLLEAMACGKSVITTARGPARDFCSEKTAYFVPAREQIVPDDPPPLGEFAGKFTWFEPDRRELARVMRHVFEHREEASARGRISSQMVHRKYTWENITRLYRRRVRDLLATNVSAPDCTEVFSA